MNVDEAKTGHLFVTFQALSSLVQSRIRYQQVQAQSHEF